MLSKDQINFWLSGGLLKQVAQGKSVAAPNIYGQQSNKAYLETEGIREHAYRVDENGKQIWPLDDEGKNQKQS